MYFDIDRGQLLMLYSYILSNNLDVWPLLAMCSHPFIVVLSLFWCKNAIIVTIVLLSSISTHFWSITFDHYSQCFHTHLLFCPFLWVEKQIQKVQYWYISIVSLYNLITTDLWSMTLDNNTNVIDPQYATNI